MLARFPRQVHYIRVLEHHTIADNAQRKLEIYHVQDQQHSDDMLMAYLPAEKILVEADLFEAGQTTPNPRTMALLYNIERVSILPTRIVSIHTGEIPVADFLRAVGQEKLVAQGEGLDAALNDMRP